jgi:DNA-binding transcriptional MerR regulator
MQPTGAYTADRASALSGVPKSTVHYWSRHELLSPSVSAEKVKLWSYADLMGLRIIYWLRQRKTDSAGAEIPRTSVKAILGVE